MSETVEKVAALVEKVGFDASGVCSASKVKTYEDVRAMCAADKCHQYDKSWACPPACGDIEYYQQLISERDTCFVVQTVAQLADDFDFEAMMNAEATQKERVHAISKELAEAGIDALVLAAGTCTICSECTYPDAPCRFPERQLVSMEAAGLLVSDVCGQADVPYNHGKGTLAYTSCILV